jgi:hypothetical protein
LAYSTREDLLPEFKAYGPCLEKLTDLKFGAEQEVSPEDKERFKDQRATNAMQMLVELVPKYSPEALYDALLGLNAFNMLRYDHSYQDQTHNPVTQNVGWLDYTHALTFSNAVRAVNERETGLWKKGLLQMAAFYGRNTPYLTEINVDDWKVEEFETFKANLLERVYDHGLPAPIFSAHIIKTGMACFEELEKGVSRNTREVFLAGLNRFLNSPLKAKHARRMVHQGVSLVRKDFV